MNSDVDFGVMLSTFGQHASPEAFRRIATTAETAGFDSVWAGDHVSFPADIPDEYPFSPSGGRQQMLTIARALVTDPDLILLDEPSEGLAPNIIADLKSLLTDVIDTGITVLLTEQNTEFAFELAERAYILSKGDVAWEGDIEVLKDREDVIGKYLSVGAVDVE